MRHPGVARTTTATTRVDADTTTSGAGSDICYCAGADAVRHSTAATAACHPSSRLHRCVATTCAAACWHARLAVSSDARKANAVGV